MHLLNVPEINRRFSRPYMVPGPRNQDIQGTTGNMVLLSRLSSLLHMQIAGTRWKSYIASPANPVGKENEMEIVEGNSFRGDKYNCVSPREKDTDADSSDDGLQRITSGNEHTEEKVPTFLGTNTKIVLLTQALARSLPREPHHNMNL